MVSALKNVNNFSIVYELIGRSYQRKSISKFSISKFISNLVTKSFYHQNLEKHDGVPHFS